MTTNENKNPRDYFYKPETNIEIPGGFLLELLALSDQLLQGEVKSESEFKYNYINEKSQIVKKFKDEDLVSGKVKKIVDWERTVDNPTYTFSLTEKGVAYARLKKFLEAIHISNIEKGVATTIYKSED